MSAIVCVSTDENGEVEIKVKSEPNSKPLDLCKQQPNNDDDPVRVKQTLKELIQSRRIAEGKDELTIDFDAREDTSTELTQEEVMRQKDRKEQNRKAAVRCREKKKHIMQILQEEEEDLKEKRRHLEEECERLVQERKNLLAYLRTHVGPEVDYDFAKHTGNFPQPQNPCARNISSSVVQEQSSDKSESVLEQNSYGSSHISSGNCSESRDQQRPKIVNKHPKQYYKERFQHDMSAEKLAEEAARQGQTEISGAGAWNYKKHYMHQGTLSTGETSATESKTSEVGACNGYGGHPSKQAEPLDFSKKDINVNSIRASVDQVENQNDHSSDATDVSSLLPLTVIQSESDASQLDSSQQSCATDVSDCHTDSSQEAPSRNLYYRQQKANIPLEINITYSSEESDSDDDAMLIDLSQSDD